MLWRTGDKQSSSLPGSLSSTITAWQMHGKSRSQKLLDLPGLSGSDSGIINVPGYAPSSIVKLPTWLAPYSHLPQIASLTHIDVSA